VEGIQQLVAAGCQPFAATAAHFVMSHQAHCTKNRERAVHGHRWTLGKLLIASD